MATKNIARTAIEGGRSNWNKHERWMSNRVHRRKTNMLVRRFSIDPEVYEETEIPVRERVYKDFADKLSAPARWFEKKMNGLTFNEIKGELMKTFDTRSLAARHIVFDHLMPRRDRITGEPETGSYDDEGFVAFDENEVFRTYANPSDRDKAKQPRPYRLLNNRQIRSAELFKKLRPSEDWYVIWKDHGYLWMNRTGKTRKAKCQYRWCAMHKTEGAHTHLVWDDTAMRSLTAYEEALLEHCHRWDRDHFMSPPYRRI